MDSVDQKIIAALRNDSRASLSALSIISGVSRTTVRSRIERMQQRGDIIGFSVVLKGDVAQDPVRGMMMIGIEGRGTDRIIRQLNGLTDVRAIHSTNGRWDLIVELGAATLEQFDIALNSIRRLEGIITSETNLLFSTRKPGR